MRVIFLNGPATAGKGTVAKCIREIFKVEVVEYSSIDYVKEVAYKHFGWDGIKDRAGRNLLYEIKQSMIKYNNLPAKKVMAKLLNCFANDVVIVDVREPDEIEKLTELCKMFGFISTTVLIQNENAVEKAEALDLCPSDRKFGKYDYDLYIDNNGTVEDLLKNVEKVFSENKWVIGLGTQEETSSFSVKTDEEKPKLIVR